MYVIIEEEQIKEVKDLQVKILDILNYMNDYKKENTQNKKNLLSVSESARYLNISEIFIRKKIESKELKIKRVGRAIRIELRELESLIKDY